jgi:monoamine oxidase
LGTFATSSTSGALTPSSNVVVVGGGLSGLVCARRLGERGVSVLVLEARGRVGGRLHSGEVGGVTVDLGGQWLTAGQSRLVALADELDVATFAHRRGRAALDEDAGAFAKLAAAVAQFRAMRRIEGLMEMDDAAGELDRVSLAAWLDDNIDNELARERIRLHADLVFATEPESLSLLAYLRTMRATGGFRPEGPDLPGGGREHRFDGGAQLLASRLAERLDVRVDEAVLAIEQHGDHCIVRSERGEYEAKHVVLAIPPALVARIEVELPAEMLAYARGVRMGAVVKVFVVYAHAFWGERGELYLPSGPVRAVVDNGDETPMLLCFVVGAEARRWHARDASERRGELLDILARHFGDEAREPTGYLEHDWTADPWSAGCVAATPPGVLAAGASWRGPHSRVHFAGTETADAWPGYMDGAIEAGERAAAEILASE